MLVRFFDDPREAQRFRVRADTQHRLEMIDVAANDLIWFAEHGALAALVKAQDREDLEFMDIGGEG